MSRLNKIREIIFPKMPVPDVSKGIIKVSEDLFIKVDKESIKLYDSDDCYEICGTITDKEIQPLIDKLKELIK